MQGLCTQDITTDAEQHLIAAKSMEKEGRLYQAFISCYQAALAQRDTFKDVTLFQRLAAGVRPSDASQDEDVVLAIIPAFNAAATISASVDSVLQQTHNNVHLLIVDDASTDSTARVLRGLAQRHPMLGCIYLRTNRGTYYAANVGLDAGRHFSFTHFLLHGADDVMHPKKIATQLTLMKKYAAQACGTGYERKCADSGKRISTSRNGASMNLYTRRVFDLLGYYDERRFGADTEYYARD